MTKTGSTLQELTEDEKSNLPKLRKRKMQLIDEIQQIKNELKNVDAELESLYYLDESSKSRNKLLMMGRRKFNQDPWKGIDYLTERGLLTREAKALAEWLHKGEGLNKTCVGEVIGGHEPLALQILEEFTKRHNFTNLFIVEALRLYLWSFRLPGENQKIERIMDNFSKHFLETNPGAFPSTDVCFVISYSIIMLNTLFHNPSIKDPPPPLNMYMEMNKEAVAAGVPRSIFQQIYDSMKTHKIEIPEDNPESDILLNAEREGWLYKQSRSQFLSGPLSWKRKWFVLNEMCLYYFDQNTDKEPRGMIPLQNVGVRKIENTNRPNMFEIYSLSDERIKACKKEEDGRVVEGRHSVYRMCAANSEDLRGWIEAISRLVTPNAVRPKSVH